MDRARPPPNTAKFYRELLSIPLKAKDFLRTALEHSLSPTRVRDGMRMVKSLHRYWVARVYWREANGWLKRLLAVSGTEDTPIRARTMYVAGHITNYYDPTQARSLAEDCLRLDSRA